jgi:hypothetical protein
MSDSDYSTYTVNVYNYTGAAYDADFVAMVAKFTAPPVNYIAGSSCFDAATTTVLAGSGAKDSYVPITSLAVGDLVQTLRHGARAVKHIGRGRGCNYTPTASAPGWTNWNTNMWKLPAAANPSAAPLIVTGGHGILFELNDPALTAEMDRANRAYFFGDEGVDDPDRVVPSVEGRYLLLAAAYPGATLLPNGFKHDYVHICLDNDGDQDMRYAVFVNGGHVTETPSEAQFLEHKYDRVDSLRQQQPLHQDKRPRL